MSSTDALPELPEPAADDLALALFDDVVTPLARRLRASGHPEAFARAGEAGATSYFEPPALGAMRSGDFDFPGGGDAIGLIDELERYWRARGDDPFAALVPRLKEIAGVLREEAARNDGEVDILCYTMF